MNLDKLFHCRNLPTLLFVLALLSSCNLPRADTTPTLDVTQAYQTVEARLTQAAASTPSPTPQATSTDSEGGTETLPAAATATNETPKPPPGATSPVKLCDQAAPGVPIDVTIPDDTKMQPGQSFTKVWRLYNSGTCTWSKNYSIALFSGETLGAPASAPIPQNVAPNQSVDISVDMIAPQNPGTYQGNWKLRNASNTWFGIGPTGDSPFWVRIVVAQSQTGTQTATPTPTTTVLATTPAPAIQVSGTTALIPSDRLNLDTNQINTGGEDLSYEISPQSQLLLVPVGSARFSVFGNSTPSIADCKSASLSEAALALGSLNQGLHLCYRTDQGLPGWLRLLNLNTNNDTLTVQILTWSTP